MFSDMQFYKEIFVLLFAQLFPCSHSVSWTRRKLLLIFGCDSSPRSPNVLLCVTLATTVLQLTTAVYRSYKGLLKDFQRTLNFGLQNLLVNKSQPPGLWDLLILGATLLRLWQSGMIWNIKLEYFWRMFLWSFITGEILENKMCLFSIFCIFSC